MSLRERDYDIIVAGGGLAGMIVASSAAHYSNELLRILVVDRNPLSVMGKKTMTGWICGDAVGKKSVEYMFSKYVEETSYHWVGFAMPVSEKFGSVGIGLQYFNAGSLDNTDIRAVKNGSFNPYDMAVSLSYGRKILSDADSIGVNLKIINSKIVESATAFAFDFGAQSSRFMEGKLLLGFAVQNIGTSLKYETTRENLPILVKLGSAYKIHEHWTASSDLVFPNDNSATLALGTDYNYKIQEDMGIAGRLGYNSRGRKVDGFNGVTVGFGFLYHLTSLDYAWMPLGDLGSTHRISVGVKF